MRSFNSMIIQENNAESKVNDRNHLLYLAVPDTQQKPSIRLPIHHHNAEMPSSPSRHPSASSLSQTAEVTRNMKLWLQARLGNTTRLQSSSEIPLINLAVNTFHLKAQHLLLGAENVAPSYLPSRVALVVDEFYVSQMLKLKKALADNLRSTLERLHERTSCSIRSVAPQLLNMYVTRGQNAAEVLRQRILDRTRLYIAAQRNVIDGKRGFNAVSFLHSPSTRSSLTSSKIFRIVNPSFRCASSRMHTRRR